MIGVCGCERAAATDVGGVPVHAMSLGQAVTRVARMVDCPGSHVVHNIASDPIVRAWNDPQLLRALQEADLTLPDGMAVVWAARLLGAPPATERVYGPDFVLAVAGDPRTRPLRHAFVGANEPVLDSLTSRLRRLFPAIDIVAAYPPPLRPVSPDAVADDIEQTRRRAAGPIDVLWVGLGTPKQQVWAYQARPYDVAKVIVTVGAAFDFLSGAKRQAPAWMGRMGVEWLFRLATEPRRLWRRYLLGNPRFVMRIARQRLGLRGRSTR
jgi:N-acetylglucosaminyldiphosphoundecaprenol N-acetyl-beta-D-mannosaminyltransferase